MLKSKKRHGRIAMSFVLTILLTLSSMAGVSAKQVQTQKTSYSTVTEIEDWGAATTKIIVDLGKPVRQGSVSKDTFSVFISRSDSRKAPSLLEEGYATITKAYISDENGNPTAAGEYAALEMQIGPNVTITSPLNYYGGSNVWIDCQYTITQLKDIPSGSGVISGLVADKFAGGTRELVDDFHFGSFTNRADNKTLTYADYSPKTDNRKNPLIIWLHGGGEGGTDPTIPLSANKSVNLITDDIQSYFGGAYVLVPQAPTRWMDGFTGRGDGTSVYENALMSLIKDYVANNKDIDTNRIYIGGCSNGGYMTLLMTRDYPGYFAAAFPTSEALKDTLISDTDLQNMMKTPTWLTDALSDTTTPPATMTIPTYNRMFAAGDKNVHMSMFPKVLDTTGLYKNANGTPYEYNGHWTWTYVYNNQCTDIINGKITTIMEWMAAQSLSKSDEDPIPAAFDIEKFKSGTYKDKNGTTLPYRYFDPASNNDVKDKYPIILYLHGEEERGTDNVKQLSATKGATIWLEPDHLAKNPVYVLAPQAPLGSTWTDEKIYEAVKDLLQKFIETHHNVDTDRIYIEGISMGGTGTWNMILKNPNMFAAAMPISGNADAFLGNDAAFEALKNMPIMVIASSDDPISPLKGSDNAVEALKRQGNTSVQYHKWEAGSVTPAHNAWATAFEKYEVVYNFLFMNSLDKTNHGKINPSNLFTSMDLGNGLTQIWDITEDTIFVIERKDKAVVIDTGMATGSLYQYIRENVLKNKDIDIEILLTHNNGDHVKGVPSFIGASQVKKIYINEADYDVAKPYFGLDENKVQLINDGDRIPFDGNDIEVIIVPGHTLGSAVFLYENYLFTGDAVGTGHVFLQSSKISIEDYVNSVQHLFDKIAGKSLTVLGGHTGECRYPLDQEYVKQMLECAKGIVNGTITPVTYWRRPGLLATYGRASIYYKAENIKTKTATLSSLALSSDKSNIEIYYPINMNEKFSPYTTTYTATVDSKNAPYIYIKSTTHSTQDTLKINDAVVNSSIPYKVTLAAGENKFDITVISKEGTTRVYNLIVTQKDLSKEYKSEKVMPGVWRIQDYAGFTSYEDMYLIEGTERALLFDTGMGKGDLAAYVKTLTNLPVDVAITHGNGDHFGQVDQFPNSTVYMSDLDMTRLPATLNTSNFKWVKEGDTIDIGGKKFEVILVPGHTLGSIVYLDKADKIAITGDAVSSGSYVFMFSTACTALDQYVEGLKRFEAKVKDLDGLTLLVGHHWQEKTPLAGNAGKQLFSDMRIVGEKVLSGEFEGILNAQNGKNILRQAYFGLAGLWYNPNNLFTEKAALGFLKLETAGGSPIIPKPVFSSFQISYTTTVSSDITNIVITPTAYYSNNKGITINGVNVKSGAPYNTTLAAGENKFDITVTGEDGSKKTYTVTITR